MLTYEFTGFCPDKEEGKNEAIKRRVEQAEILKIRDAL
jgi:hypothetical protein